MLTNNEMKLDKNGKGTCQINAHVIRPKGFENGVNIRSFRTNIFRVFAFKKLADGEYDPNTLKDITPFCTMISLNPAVASTINLISAINR